MRRFPANDTGVYPTPKDPKTPGFAFVAILSLAFQLIAQIISEAFVIAELKQWGMISWLGIIEFSRLSAPPGNPGMLMK